MGNYRKNFFAEFYTIIIQSFESTDRTSLIDQKSNKSSKRSMSSIEMYRQVSDSSVRVESTTVSELLAPTPRYRRKYNRDKVSYVIDN